MRTIILMLASVLLVSANLHSQVIADHLPGCMADPVFDGKSCDNNTHNFGIIGGQVVAQNVDGENAFAGCCNGPGGNNRGNFEYAPLDISSFSNVMISFDYSASNTDFEDEFPAAPSFGCLNAFEDNSHDQIVFTYSIDGGPFIEDLYVHGETQAAFTGTWLAGPLNGQTLTIKVFCANKAQAEIFYFENLVITADPPTIAAGPDVTVCNDTPVMLDGTGVGMWTGGSGSYSDPTDPDATYTASGAEGNTTVTLTYAGNPTSPSCASAYPPPTDDVALTFTAPTATLAYADPSFTGDFCSGDCEVIDVVISGGTAPYTLSMMIAAGPISFPFPIPGFDINDNITICYDENALLPSFDIGSNTLTVPGLASGASGTISMTSISDANSCSTALSESVLASFQTTPELNDASLEECDDGSGQATFTLTDAIATIDPAGIYTVAFYEMIDMTGPIPGPMYTSGSGVIYAFATEGACTSDPAAVTLTVEPPGDVGTVTIACDGLGSTICETICDQGGDGELVDLTISLDDPSSTYSIEVITTPGTTDTYTFTGDSYVLQVSVTGPTTVQIVSIIENGACPDVTDLGSIIQLDVIVPPMLVNPGDQSSCAGGYELLSILGTNLTGNEAYYFGSNGTGGTIAVGSVITTDETIYIYDGVPGCDDEVSFEITVGTSTIYDEPTDVITCGSYTLPDITGTAVGGNAMYYTGPLGTGTSYAEGESIAIDIPILYIYDITSSCQTNEPSFSISITPGDTLVAIVDTVVCDLYILEPIRSSGTLSGDEAYYDLLDGQGRQLLAGDTITYDSLLTWVDTNTIILFAYDSLDGCIAQEAFRLTIETPAFAGVGDTISYCNAIGVTIDLMAAIGLPDTTGVWSTTAPVSLSDSTDVNLSPLSAAPGQYLFVYTILDSICGAVSTTLTIDIGDAAFAGLDGPWIACRDDLEVDLFLILLADDFSGSFTTVPPNVGLDLSDPRSVTFESATVNTLDIVYIVDGADGCPADTAIIMLTIRDTPFAGVDTVSSTCQGSQVDLASLIPGAVFTGRFEEVAPASGLTGNTVNTTGLLGDYGYYHITADAVCGTDTALIILSVSTTATAGIDVVTEVCDPSQPLRLSSLLMGADAGGVFEIDGLPVPDEIFPVDYATPITAVHIVGDGITCDYDTSLIELQLVDFSISVQTSSQSICPGRAQFVTLNYTSDREYTVYLSIMNSNTGTTTNFTRILELGEPSVAFQMRNTVDGIENGTNLEPDQRYNVTIDSVVSVDGSCVIDLGDFFFVTTVDELVFELDTTICQGDSVFAIGQFWTESFSSVMQTSFGCDSIIDITINLLRRDTTTFDGQRCTGTELDVDGTIFNETNPSGQVTLTNAVGCDSLIVVDLTYVSTNEITVDEMICDGESITVGGEVFDASNPSGSVMTTGVGGDCDTTFTVALQIGSSQSTLIDDVLCTGASITVGGEVFDGSTPMGTVMLRTSMGCDSIVDVDLSFADETMLVIDDAICAGDTITVNSMQYYIGNASGELMITGVAGDCDTIIDIDLVELSGSVGMLDLFSCEPDSVLVIGGVTLDINSPMATIPSGTNEVGCDSITEVTVTYGGIGLSLSSVEVAEGTQLLATAALPIDQISWTPEQGLSCIDCTDPIATPSSTTTYLVTVVSGDCSETASITVTVLDNETITFPNIINPDGSPANNTFYIKAPTELGLRVETMIIYDRWGNKVFDIQDAPTSDPSAGWAGRYRGKDVSQGVYVYYVKLYSTIDPNYTDTRTGDLTIIR